MGRQPAEIGQLWGRSDRLGVLQLILKHLAELAGQHIVADKIAKPFKFIVKTGAFGGVQTFEFA